MIPGQVLDAIIDGVGSVHSVDSGECMSSIVSDFKHFRKVWQSRLELGHRVGNQTVCDNASRIVTLLDKHEFEPIRMFSWRHVMVLSVERECDTVAVYFPPYVPNDTKGEGAK